MNTTTGLGKLITGPQAAFLTGRTPSTIRDWVARGHLTPARVRDGRNLYRVADVLTAERETRNRNTRRRPHADGAA